MKRTRVKICGFTRSEEAVEAANLGVDAIGLVFYQQSPRFVDISQAKAIAQALPAFVTVVALFVDASEEQILEILRSVPIDCLQFHGDEPAQACRKYGRPYIKAIRMRPDVDVNQLAVEYDDASGLLLDTYQPDSKGGTGASFDWTLVPRHCPLPIILAGGLDLANVGEAITTVQPYAVDVSSGVEIAKGRKDSAKMASFIEKVLETDRIL